jgi:hypothetical protein
VRRLSVKNLTKEKNEMSTGDLTGCSRCDRKKREVFRCFKKRYVFDVSKAREMVSDSRAKIELDTEDVKYSVNRNTINKEHVPHVNTAFPGIVCHVFYTEKNGTLIHGHRLIDGNHRATRCLELGIPFYVYVLTEEESVKILRKAPRGARPGRIRRKTALVPVQTEASAAA